MSAGGTLDPGGPLVLVGAGRMGGTMLERWLARGLPGAATHVLDPAPPPEIVDLLARSGATLNTAPDRLPRPAVIVLAIKPQMLAEAMPQVAGAAGPGTLVVSVLAGKPLAALAAGLPPGTAIVRAMPNTPAAVGRGITVAVPNRHVTAAQREIASGLLAATGEMAWIDDEGLMDAVTAVSGSGPAYVFLLAECLAAAGAAAGLPPELAARLARVTVAGSGELLHRSQADPATLRRNVTSPGGTTAAALEVLMGEDALQRLMTAAVAAARRRGGELAG